MSAKDCIRLKKKLDPADREVFDEEYRMATENELMSPGEAFTYAAEATMDYVLQDRNELADDIAAQGGYIDKVTLENLVNPQSYKPGIRGGAANIANVSTAEFDALLEEVAPTPAKPTPVPAEPEPKSAPGKKVLTEGDASMYVRKRPGKKLAKSRATDLRKIAKAAGISGYSGMNKPELVEQLQTWQEDRAIAALPEPSPAAAADLRAAYYTRADSSTGVVVTSKGLERRVTEDRKGFEFAETKGDPAMAHWARHFGASVEKRADTHEGGKTGKGYHFQGTQPFADFVKAYTGKTFLDENRLTNGGEPTHVNYEDERVTDPSETYAVGDKVNIIAGASKYHAGEVIDIEIDPFDNRPLHAIRFEDSDGQTFEEMHDAVDLEHLAPAKPRKEAADILKAAAKHGVSGADEALTGLANLFGGKSKFSSGFSFDEETYAKAKPHFKKSLEEFIAAGKSLKEFLTYILENFGEGIKSYLRQFHQDVSDGTITIRGVNDVQLTTPESDRSVEVRAEPADRGDTGDAGTEATAVPEKAGERPAAEEVSSQVSIGLPVDSTADAGKQGDIGLLGDTGEFQPAVGATGHQDGRRGSVVGAERVPTQPPGDQQAQTSARETGRRLRLKPTTSTWVQSDPTNITESLPALFPEQHDDVAFAEKRLFDDGARGVMFTNGTGTGKTFTGLGIAKRFVMQGKDNILIVVPGEKVASDWIKSGSAVQLEITKLKNTKDSGRGVVVTTYANFAENDEIAKRGWDLIIPDEAHKLSENMAGNATNALNKLRAITGHPDGVSTYAESMERELLDKIKGIKSQMKDLQQRVGENEFMTPDQVKRHNEKYNELSEKVDALYEIWQTRYAEHRLNRNALWEAKTTKRLDLTATPFAYEKSVDHAEGFLFEYDRTIDQKGRGYNAVDARGAFFVEHFGYRMRYGKLTEPEADVDRGLMQRQFNQWLKEQGALRGRVLTVDHDYSREFVAIDDLVGSKIDEGWDLIQARGMDKDNPKTKGYQIMEAQLRKVFNYHARVRMLEAIKARWAVDRARKHMALGRKVVMFHSRIQGGTMNPFHMFASAASIEDLEVVASDDDRAQYVAAAAEFVNERNDLMTLDINTVRPLDLFEREFGDQMTVYNGTITNKQKRENPDRFNSDSEDIQIIAVQDQGGKEGISLHDATGANQRVLINLGLPVQPTQAIQIEGRIYRVGQMSNAIFEYFNTGTNFERMTFAEKISARAGTAENLALGEQARTLKDAFIDAYEDPTFSDPGEGQGIGGKEIDRANWEATTEFERAKTHYFGTLKTKGRRDQRAGMDYFATPEPLGVKMVEWSGIRPNESVLEPSAGHGAIGRYLPDNVDSTFVEPSSELISKLALRAPGKHRQMRFEDLDVGGNKYNAIVMNPPFGSGGATAIAHLNKAMHHLKNGGRIVALIPEGPAADKKFDNMFYGKEGELDQLQERVKKKRKEGGSIAEETRRIDDLTNFHMRASISLPAVTFTRASTGVASRIVVIDKITNKKANIINQSPRDVHADTIKDFFDKIEGISVPDRTKLEESSEEYLTKEGLAIGYNEADETWRISGRTFDHRVLIKRALGDDVEYSNPNGYWVSKVDPTDLLYQEMTAPQAAVETAPEAATPADMAAAAAALMSSGPAVQFNTAETTHAKKGIDLFVAAFKERVGREEYSRALKIAKAHGGYYSRFKGKGAVPGFQFESAESRAAFLKEASRKPLAMRSPWDIAVNQAARTYRYPSMAAHLDAIQAERRGLTPDQWLAELEQNPPDPSIYKIGYDPKALRDRRGGGATKRQVRQWLAKPLKRISSRVPIEIVAKASDIKTLHELASDAKGWVVDGKVYLVAENIRSQSDAETVLAHEAVGHLGLEGVLGHKKTNELVGDIINMKVEEMLFPGTHPELARILDTLRRDYIDGQGKYTLNPKDEALEVIARIAESKPRIGPFIEIYNKIALWFKQQLARWGIGDPGMVKIEDALVRAVDFVKSPPSYYTGEGADGAAAMRQTPRFVVAARTNEGQIIIGEPGQIHADLLATENLGIPVDQDMFEMGLADQEGNFLTREEALQAVQETMPGFEPWDSTDKMDSLDYKTRAAPLGKPKASRKPLASRKPYRTEPRPGETPEEFERYKKLGLQGKQTLWQRISNIRSGAVTEAFDSAVGRGYEGLFDGLIAIKEFEKKTGVGLGDNDYENSAYVSARLATGVADMMSHILHFGPLQWQGGIAAGVENTRGLLEVFGDLGAEQLNDWLMWMGANRAKELMREGRERNLSNKDIAAGIAKAEGREDLFNKIKNEYAFMNQSMLNFAEEAGLIDPVKRAEWDSSWYVPFYRLSEDELQAPRLRRGMSHQNAGIRRLFGAELPTADLLENIVTNWLKLTDASVKNHALRLMIDNFEGKELGSGQELVSHETMKFTRALVPRSEIRKRILQDRAFAKQVAEFLGLDMETQMPDPETGEPQDVNMLDLINEINKIPAQGFEQLWAITAPKDPDVVQLKRNGKNEYWRINAPGLLRATGHMQEQSSQGKGMRAARWFKRLLTTGVTMSPDFMVRNFIRDAAHSWAINPDNQWFAVDSLKGLKKALDEDPIYQAMMAAGGSFQGGYVHATD
ncbi:MAG: DEAD/DEAH box helicase family protein, partial [Gammaproteobacteria bacterium]|nr:DEAD/DEAH box helicase family protein [Gammaproteobacteria bacterium]